MSPRTLGLIIGAATGPVGGFAQSWSGNADGRLHVGLLMTLVGAILGALALPWLTDPAPDGQGTARPSLPFLALFGFAVAVVAGTFAAFPVGASLGAFGGAVGGLVAGLVSRVGRLAASRVQAPLTALAATTAALVAVAVWVA